MNDPLRLDDAFADFIDSFGLSKAPPSALQCARKFFVAGAGYAAHIIAVIGDAQLEEDIEAALDELGAADREHVERN